MPQSRRESLAAGTWGGATGDLSERAPWAPPAVVCSPPKRAAASSPALAGAPAVARRSLPRGSADRALVLSNDGATRVGFFAVPTGGEEWADCVLSADAVPSDPLMEGPWTEELAAELRAFALAAEADAQHAAAVVWYAKELKVWMHIASSEPMPATDGASGDSLKTRGLEIMRCCEGAARCLALDEKNEEALAMHERALRCAARVGLRDDDPVVSGAKVAAADCHIIAANAAEQRRAHLCATPEDDPTRKGLGSDQWRDLVFAAMAERNQRVSDARVLYTDAVISYRVAAAIRPQPAEPPRTPDPAGLDATLSASRTQLLAEAAALGSFAPQEAHCLMKIAQGCCLIGDDARAALFQKQALEVYRSYCTAQSDAPQSPPGACCAAPPYCAGFEYDIADFDARAADAGDGARIRELAKRVGCATAGDVVNGYNTWLPTVLEVEDALDDGALSEALAAARAAAPGFIQSLAAGDRRACLGVLRRSPLAAFIGIVEQPGEALVCAAGAREPFVVQDCPYAEALLRRSLPPLAFYSHLALWADLSAAEVAMCHGHSWEGRPRQFRLPLCEAVRGGDRALVALLLDLGCDPRACSPHDMRTPLMIAVDAGDRETAVLLLHHPLVELDWTPREELYARRAGAMFRTAISPGPVTPAKARRLAFAREVPVGELLELVLRQPLAKALGFYDAHRDEVLLRLSHEGAPEDAARCFGPGAPLQERLEAAISHSLRDPVLADFAVSLLTFLSPERKQLLACITDDLDLFKALLADGCSGRPGADWELDVNWRHEGQLLVVHHIQRGNRDIVAAISDLPPPGLKEHLLTQMERRALEQMLGRWTSNPGSPQ
eukprot:TRINITY_DN20100_c0_g1_i1.p1 TRINITY_DN20100_c0_g1~~TRINITY_DN20100_c0_g1_i1.p1  ORF type:complete len:867 (+),score=252.66 TRINITY_DN20100_c0_g1_i1:84-2603(+)